MTDAREAAYYAAAAEFVGTTLAAEEVIVQIRKSQTRYGRPTFVIYRANVCTLEDMTGNEPKNRRHIDVAIDVDTRRAVSGEGQWFPFDDTSVYETA